MLFYELFKFAREPMIGDDAIDVAVTKVHECIFRLAYLARRFDQRVEYRLQVESRAADDFEHLGCGGLLLKRLSQLIQQPRVFDGDDSLSGEVFDQLDLLVSE